MSSFAEGKEWLLHTAANMVTSMAASRRFLTAAAAQRLDTVLSVGNLWPFGLVFAGWALVRVVGGPVGVAVTSALRLWGAYSAVDSVQDILGELTDWAKVCAKSTENSQAETEQAAELFAVAITHGLLDGLELLLIHRVFVSARRVLVRRVPVPERLAVKMEKAKAETKQRAETEAKQKAETEAKRKQRTDAERDAKQKAETESKQKNRALAEAEAKQAEAKRKLSAVAELAEAAGAHRAAQSVEGIGAGAVVAVAVAATLVVGVVLVSRSSR